MKKLTRILLINWLYYGKQLIELGEINFLTGKTGAGKSTVIDALQIVLLGETNARNFNKAANESSQRTLDGYLRADIDGNSENSRRGKDFSSYIVCEFLDDLQGTFFSLGSIFDCRSDGSMQQRYFSYSGPIPENCFIVERRPMEIAALRKYLNAEYKTLSRIYDSNKEYRADVLAKWNVHTEQVFHMLKRAVSFRPIVDIRQFITENICDTAEGTGINIEAMQQNIREYKRHEEIAQRQEEQASKLREIAADYTELQRCTDNYRQHEFLAAWAGKEELAETIRQLTLERDANRDKMELLKQELSDAEKEIQEKELHKETIAAECAGSEVQQTENRLKGEKQNLISEQARLAGGLKVTLAHIRREAEFVRSLQEKIDDLPQENRFTKTKTAAEAASGAFRTMENSGTELFSAAEGTFRAAADASQELSQAVGETSFALGMQAQELRKQQSEMEATLSRLRRDIKDYPDGLLDLKQRLTEELKKPGREAEIEILADVLEIADGEDAWRGAVEGYLNTQKFYLLVEPAIYEEALELFNRLKGEYPRQSFGLVDLKKLREKEKLQRLDNSLANKVATDNPLARDYINYLLGHVVCCAHVGQLREHRTAITQEGMLFQGYVARPLRRQQMEDAFIGRKAVQIRIRRLEAELQMVRKELQEILPVYQFLDGTKDHEYIFNAVFLEQISQCRKDYLRGLEINTELDRLDEELAGLDLFWLDARRAEMKELQAEIDELRTQTKKTGQEIGALQEKVRALEFEILPAKEKGLKEKEDSLQERFTEDFVQRIGLPRYALELRRLKRAATVAENFGRRLSQSDAEQRNAREKLIRARTVYVQSYQPCSYVIDAPHNEEFAEKLAILEESELPQYREKIRKARESALEQFQNDFLYKLQSSIKQVQDQVRNLNKALKYAQFGSEQYQFRADRNPDYAEYYDMIMAPELMEGEGGLFTWEFQEKYSTLIEDLFNRIAISDDTQLNARRQSELQQNIERYTDFRTYLKFDLETTDREGNRQLLSQTLNKKSGGETQTPFYIAVLASFAQLYQVNNHSSGISNTVRLVVFDEAFNKMDSDRIVESIHLLRKMQLQAIICTPPDKIADIMPLADRTLLVHKGKRSMRILPWSKETE